MSKKQLLHEAKACLQAGRLKANNRSANTGRVFIPEDFYKQSEALSVQERQILFDQCQTALRRERRRANAQSATYDPGRHIKLFLALKRMKEQKSATPTQ